MRGSPRFPERLRSLVPNVDVDVDVDVDVVLVLDDDVVAVVCLDAATA